MIPNKQKRLHIRKIYLLPTILTFQGGCPSLCPIFKKLQGSCQLVWIFSCPFHFLLQQIKEEPAAGWERDSSPGRYDGELATQTSFRSPWWSA